MSEIETLGAPVAAPRVDLGRPVVTSWAWDVRPHRKGWALFLGPRLWCVFSFDHFSFGNTEWAWDSGAKMTRTGSNGPVEATIAFDSSGPLPSFSITYVYTPVDKTNQFDAAPSLILPTGLWAGQSWTPSAAADPSPKTFPLPVTGNMGTTAAAGVFAGPLDLTHVDPRTEETTILSIAATGTSSSNRLTDQREFTHSVFRFNWPRWQEGATGPVTGSRTVTLTVTPKSVHAVAPAGIIALQTVHPS